MAAWSVHAGLPLKPFLKAPLRHYVWMYIKSQKTNIKSKKSLHVEQRLGVGVQGSCPGLNLK